jgi:hypothetical protein
MRDLVYASLAIGLLGCSERPSPTAPSAEGFPPASIQQPSNVTILKLGFSLAIDIDEFGRVVGWDLATTPTRAVWWRPGSRRGLTGSTTYLSGLGGDTYVLGSNDVRQSAGSSSDGTVFHAVLWDGTTRRTLGEPAGATESLSDDVSEPAPDGTRRVAGNATFGTTRQPVVWTFTGTGATYRLLSRQILPSPSAGGGQAIDVNREGLVTGDVWPSAGQLGTPAKWLKQSDGSYQFTALHLLPGKVHGQGLGLNASGAIVGHNGANTGCNAGVIWPANSLDPIVLPDLTGGACSFAWSINNAGQIAGGARDTRGRTQAVLWLPRTGGGYTVLALGRPKGFLSGEARSLNEPLAGAGEGLVVEVVGVSGCCRATLWRVTLPR